MKKAIIIGATSGIGRALAKTLAEDGYRVGITGRRARLLEELKSETPERYSLRTLDVSDIRNATKTMEELAEELGGVDLLVICSGTGEINEALDFEVEKSVIDVNVTGFTVVADWAFRLFERQRHGHLVVITSVAGLRGEWRAPSYNASKAWQMNYAEALRKKAKKSNLPIYVTDIRPGFVDTAMAKGEGLFWVATVEKAVRQIYGAIRRRRKVAYVTKRWGFVAAFMKCVPNFIYDRM